MSKEEENLTPTEVYMVRMVALAILVVAILAGWQLYLSYVHLQWEQGLVEYVVYYQLREMTGIVYLIINCVVIVGGVILTTLAVRDKNVRTDIP